MSRENKTILREGVSLRKIDKAAAYAIIKTLNFPMTSAFIKDLKILRDRFNKDKNYSEFLEALKTFATHFGFSVEEEEEKEPESKAYSPEDLKLVCYLTLS